MDNEALDLARQKLAEMREQGIKIRPKTPLEKLAENPLSLRRAISAFCCQCMGGPDEPKYKQHIANCTAPHCALYRVRPHQRKAEAENG